MISKKELLSITGISYGQLYRWKRENLIPEEWFIKQSSFTGQETFFPKDKIIDRINLIISLKDNYSLEDISKIILEQNEYNSLNLDAILEIKEIDNYILNHIKQYSPSKSFSINEVIFFIIMSGFLRKNLIIENEYDNIYENNKNNLENNSISNMICKLCEMKHEKIKFIIFHKSNDIFLDDRINILSEISLINVSDMLKVKYFK